MAQLETHVRKETSFSWTWRADSQSPTIRNVRVPVTIGQDTYHFFSIIVYMLTVSCMGHAVASTFNKECSLYWGPGKSCQIAGEALSYCLTSCQGQVMQLHSEQRRQVAQDIVEENWGPRILPCVCLGSLFHLALLRLTLRIYILSISRSLWL